MSEFPYEPASGPLSRQAAQVVSQFERQRVKGYFTAGQLVVRHSGKVLINLALGEGQSLAGGSIGSVSPETLFPVYSAGKPMAALCIALLQQRGMVDLNTPVATYLPEFGQTGKTEITVDDVLTHRGGIVIPELWQGVKEGRDESWFWQQICAAAPRYPRGTFAYMPGEYGWILNRLVQRLDGRALERFFTEELLQPLGLREMHYGLAQRDPNEVILHRWLGKSEEWVAGANAADYFEGAQTSLSLFKTHNPAITMVSNAASLAAFYEWLFSGGKTANGQPLIEEQLLRAYTGRQVAGWNRSINTYLAMGRGFMLGTLTPSSFGWWNSGRCFGHAGVFSVLAFADAATGISTAIVTNGNRSVSDFFRRFIPLAQKIRSLGRG
ncbi:MAG: serine hydrolase domain-containing protein [Pseudomonadota bacterium]|nr:serine hydrolase domain-containing protein [Pseudomonadota bacterium]